MLSTTIPFSLEFLALKRMPPRIFGVMVSPEPVVAVLIGYILLGEILGTQAWLALGLVSIATFGATLSGKRQ